MQKLIRGIHKFQSDVFRANEELFRRLVGGQTPQALFVTCSDSRVVPDLICQTDPGDLFVLRNAGNLIPPYSAGPAGGEAAAVEYAIRALGIKDVIVCGHTRCGAMQSVLNPDALRTMPQVRQWLANADAACDIVRTHYADLPEEARWKVMAQENVLVQLENLRTHPAVAVGLASGELKLHAWVYKMETGEVFAFHPESGQFVPLAHPDGTGATAPAARGGLPRLTASPAPDQGGV